MLASSNSPQKDWDRHKNGHLRRKRDKEIGGVGY